MYSYSIPILFVTKNFTPLCVQSLSHDKKVFCIAMDINYLNISCLIYRTVNRTDSELSVKIELPVYLFYE